MDLEEQRLENVRQKQKLLADLKLEQLEKQEPSRSTKTSLKTASQNTPQKVKRRKLDIAVLPTRKSSRVSGARPNYNEDGGAKYQYMDAKPRSKNSAVLRGSQAEDVDTPSDLRNLAPVAGLEDIKVGWTAWTPSGPAPVRDDAGTFHFDDQPRFTPNKSPEEMLREGCFGGSYFRPLKSRKLGTLIEGDWKELPPDWHTDLDVATFLTSPTYDAEVNKFKVVCGQSIEEWEAAGWIAFEYDIRGWFQWYCRFWMGRRCDDDERQIGRWDRCVGKRGRWRRLLLKKYVQMGVRDVFDIGDEEDQAEVSPVMHQTCHHWAFEVRQGDLDDAWKEFG